MKSLTTLPIVRVSFDGDEIDQDLSRAMTHLRVRQELSVPAMCEVTFEEAAGDALSMPDPGAHIELLVSTSDEPLFAGDVTAIEYVYLPDGGRSFVVRGYDAMHRMRKNQTVRAHVQATLSSLASDLAGDAGLSVDAAVDGPTWEHLIQHRQNDLELLVEMAERCGVYLVVQGDTLELITLEGNGDTVGLALGESLLEARVEVNGDPACRSVSTSGWDPLRAEAHTGSASSARVGRDVDAEAPPGDLGGSGDLFFVGEATSNTEHADGIAQAELDRRLAREVVLTGVAEGDPLLRPGTVVEVSGIASEVAGAYVLTEVTHTVDDAQGFVSAISTAPPRSRARARAAVMALGNVVDVDDPDDLGRVRVKLPAYGDVETDWMGVLTPGAGGSKGFIGLPDVGDDVLLLFANEDPGEGVVLGGLYGVNGPPDSGVEGGAVKRYTWLTPGGHRIALDDAQSLIKIQDTTGSYVEMTPEMVTLHAAVDLTMEAPSRAIVIRAKTVDFLNAP